nr:heavy metal-associated isoprenylated plant protein 26-like [Ipomoea batatas]
MGILDHLSDMFDCSSGRHYRRRYKKRRQLQTVEMRVKMDCEGCERKVRSYVDPDRVVARVAHRTGKKVELWPYVPYDVVAHPYAPGVYDKKAPAGYVRRAEDPHVYQLARASSTEVRYTTAFSDDNPAACAVM